MLLTRTSSAQLVLLAALGGCSQKLDLAEAKELCPIVDRASSNGPPAARAQANLAAFESKEGFTFIACLREGGDDATGASLVTGIINHAKSKDSVLWSKVWQERDGVLHQVGGSIALNRVIASEIPKPNCPEGECLSGTLGDTVWQKLLAKREWREAPSQSAKR